MENDFTNSLPSGRQRPQLRLVSSLEPAVPPKPHDVDVERAVLGAIMLDNGVLSTISFLQPDHFFEPLHQEVFEVARRYIETGKPADAIALRSHFIESDQVVGNLTAAQYIGTLAGAVVNLPATNFYARTIVDLAERRAAITTGEDLIASAYDSALRQPLGYVVSQAKRQLDDISDRQAVLDDDDDGLMYADDDIVIRPVPHLIKGVVPCVSKVAVYGVRGSAKSFFICDLGFHIALGKPYLGRRVTRAPVLYVALEGQAGVPGRIAALRSKHGSGAWFASMTLPIAFGTPEAAASAVALLGQKCRAIEKRYGQPVGLIMIDTLGQALAGANENEAAAVAMVMAACQQVITDTGATVLFAAHPGKNLELGLRGSSALEATFDNLIMIDRKDQEPQRDVYLKKVKEGVEAPLCSFTLGIVELGKDEDGDPITSCIIDYCADEKQHKPKRDRPKPGSAAAHAYEELCELINNDEYDQVTHSRVPPEAKCVSRDKWRDACKDARLTKGGNVDAERKAFDRAFEWLESGGLIARYGDYVWLLKGLSHSATCPGHSGTCRPRTKMPAERTCPRVVYPRRG